MIALNGKNCIGFSDSALGATTFQAINPSSNKAFGGLFVQAIEQEVNLAVEKADKAFLDLSVISISQRVSFLKEIAQSIRQHADHLIQWYVLETGLPVVRAKSELNRSCLQFELYADAIQSGYALGLKIDCSIESKIDLRKMNMPLGPVVVFGASNFPFAYSTLGGDVASALAAGCPVIVKAHPMHPHTSEYAARIILSVAKNHHLPDGVFSHLQAIDYSVGEYLVKHPQVKAVGFTGSVQGGTTLVNWAANRPTPIPVFAEMGSSNPIVFTTNALKERCHEIAAEVSNSIALNAGQFCTSPGLLFFVQSSVSEDFLLTLTSFLKETESQVMLHPGIFQQYTQQANLQLEGVEVLVNGERMANAIKPTLVRISGSQFLSQSRRAEEVFGSFATAVMCLDEQEMICCLKSLPGQLTASLYASKSEAEKSTPLISILQQLAGRIIFNGVPTGVTVSVAMQHGGPYPSSSNAKTTAVGLDAIERFMRPVCYQNVPEELLPEALKRANSGKFLRFVNGFFTDDPC